MGLDAIRKEIDAVDYDIVQAVVRRLLLMNHVAEFKHENSLSLRDHAREEALIQKCILLFKEEGINDPAFARELFELLIRKSVQVQEERMQELRNE